LHGPDRESRRRDSGDPEHRRGELQPPPATNNLDRARDGEPAGIGDVVVVRQGILLAV
jgi:hypothetical protein